MYNQNNQFVLNGQVYERGPTSIVTRTWMTQTQHLEKGTMNVTGTSVTLTTSTTYNIPGVAINVARNAQQFAAMPAPAPAQPQAQVQPTVSFLSDDEDESDFVPVNQPRQIPVPMLPLPAPAVNIISSSSSEDEQPAPKINYISSSSDDEDGTSPLVTVPERLPEDQRGEEYIDLDSDDVQEALDALDDLAEEEDMDSDSDSDDDSIISDDEE